VCGRRWVPPARRKYDFYQGPQTIGLVPRQLSRGAASRASSRCRTSRRKPAFPGVQTHCGFLPENPNEPLYAESVKAIHTVAEYCQQNGQTFRCETGRRRPSLWFAPLRMSVWTTVG